LIVGETEHPALWQITEKEETKMDIFPLEFLKLLWFGIEATLESFDQRLVQLEEKLKEIP
jgi:hypothetical protein